MVREHLSQRLLGRLAQSQDTVVPKVGFGTQRGKVGHHRFRFGFPVLPLLLQ